MKLCTIQNNLNGNLEADKTGLCKKYIPNQAMFKQLNVDIMSFD